MKTDIAIVGAGFAGLAAADDLTRAGHDVVVLEARDRAGGRSRTDHFEDGSWVDIGGQWLGPGHDRMYALAARFGKAVWPMYVAGRHVLHLGDRRSTYRGLIPLTLPPLALANVGWAFFRLEQLARTIPLEYPWRARRAEELDQQTFGDWMRRNLPSRHARAIVKIAAESVFACDPDDLSLLHALFYLHSGGGLEKLTSSDGGAQQDRVEGGTQGIADALAAAVRRQGGEIRLSTAVLAIREERGHVAVHTSGETCHAREVIVAAPPVLVREIDFAPALPSDLAAWMEGTPPGRVIKCFAFYSRPFWRQEGLSGSAVGDQPPLHVIFDGTPPGAGHGILVGFIEGREADHWRERPQEERRDAVLACLERFFGPRALEVTRYVDHAWAGEPWSRGCYAGMSRPGVLTRARVDLRRPFGHVHWAGTETASRYNGYLEGAVLSGERAAAAARRALAGGR